MCGFAGLMGPVGQPADRIRLAGAMANTLVHRGPDDAGSWVSPDGAVALGFRRLAILDLTIDGRQPMTSGSGRYTAVFNGEIYNFADLRIELERAGVRFRGRSDTEVLLGALDTWGFEATLPRLWGMFAIATWDQQERQLLLARDRLGKKPLYYSWSGGVFLFGSELKALCVVPGFSPSVDRNALTTYFRYCSIPAPMTIYDGVFKLPPASWAAIGTHHPHGSLKTKCFWDVSAIAADSELHPAELDDDAAEEELRSLLVDSVRLRMVADTPLGAFLSGGIDSTAVVGTMQTLSSRRVQTFSIGFQEREYDEIAWARAVAQRLGTDHTELTVTSDDAVRVVPKLPDVFDEPFSDSSQIPTLLVARLARSQVTVALSGDGGDEALGGYRRYVAGPRLWRILSGLPLPLRVWLAALLRDVLPERWDALGRYADHLLPVRYMGLLSGNRVQKLAGLVGVASLVDLRRRLISTWQEPGELVLGGFEPSNSAEELFGDSFLRAPAHRMMLDDQLRYLPSDILTKLDRATMAVSLEARCPFLDHRLIEFGWRLPLNQKIRNGRGKWLLRRLLDRMLPSSLLERPKQGFGVPIDAWLRGPLRSWAEDLLSVDRLRRQGYLRPEPVQRLLEAHMSGRRNQQYELWAVLMFQAWLDAHPRFGLQS